MEKVNLTVVAPVFNEAEGIDKFNSRLNKVLYDIEGLKYKIVYVVDKSDDNSLDVLRDIALNNRCIRVIGLSSRFGHQASLLAGIENSLSSDAIIMMDSDLQHPPELIPQLLDKFKQGYDIVYTVRLDTDGIGWFRKKAGNSFYSLLSYLAGFKVHPNAADFRLISSRVATNLVYQFKEQHLFLRGIFSWMGFNSIGVNFHADKRFAGSSK